MKEYNVIEILVKKDENGKRVVTPIVAECDSFEEGFNCLKGTINAMGNVLEYTEADIRLNNLYGLFYNDKTGESATVCLKIPPTDN